MLFNRIKMRQYITSLGLILISLTVSCNATLTSVSKNSLENVNTPVSETANANNYLTQQTEDKIFDFRKVKFKYPLVWVGGVSVTDGIINSDNSVWSFDEAWMANAENPQISHDRFSNPDYPFIKRNEIVLVDIMNCGGYIGSGKISYKTIYDSMFEWRLTFDKETIATNAVEKIKKCSGNTDLNDEFLSSEAFAVAPQDAKRKNIKINQVNTKKIFLSLPKEIQKLLKQRFVYDGQKKGELSLEQDDWTDIDGDGKIDLISISTDPDGDHPRGLVLMLIKGKWKEIYQTLPA